MRVLMSDLGQFAAFDDDGQQIPELQRSAFELWARNAVAAGYDPEGAVIELPSQRGLKVVIRRIHDGWNWEPIR